MAMIKSLPVEGLTLAKVLILDRTLPASCHFVDCVNERHEHLSLLMFGNHFYLLKNRLLELLPLMPLAHIAHSSFSCIIN